MQNLVLLPNGAVPPGIDDLATTIGTPPFIIAEGNMVAYYTALGTTIPTSIAVAVCPTRTDYPLLDADSKSVGTYEKPGKNFFVKKGVAIVGGDAIDLVGTIYPTAVYHPKFKKFFVYYIGVVAGPAYNICVASGYSYNELQKHTVSGVVTKVITDPGAGWTVFGGIFPLYAYYDKEENLIKLYYTCVAAGPIYQAYLATSRNGYDF
jgi:hypothetical protein